MTPLHSGAATLPRGFRYHDSDYPAPKTPEPFAGHEEIQPPSPPRPRFKLKRRIASRLNAPTQQFLQSVAAADVPIPSIEGPELAIADEQMIDSTYPVIHKLGMMEDITMGEDFRGRRAFSPPKTPAPGAVPSLSPRRYPNWSIDSAFSSGESSPECESSRPSTARSTQTSASLFSRFSIVSEDLQCTSPDADPLDIINSSSDVTDEAIDISSKLKGKRRRAVWTRAMSDHLWSTYLMYLQDPKVTPFRTGKSSIPPHGVCLRVAREAKRSWRGPKTQARTGILAGTKSGSNTPTAESFCVFIQWPHTCAATRAHLRDLCKLKAASSAVRTNRYLSHSPTPFGRTVTRYWNRRSTPARTPSAFSSQDMAMSLTISTSETMQPQGPLAQLTSSVPDPVEDAASSASQESPNNLDVPFMEQRRLGSPFAARSYGPSSSAGLPAGLSFGPQRQTHTLGPRRSLQSPARLTRSRSNTQKRRTRQLSNEPRKTKRPSLASDMWTEPTTTENTEIISTGPEFEFSSTNSKQHDELFVPRTNIEELFAAPLLVPQTQSQPFVISSSSLAPPDAPPPRLGSPFSVSTSSFSFPNRLTQPDNLHFGVIRRPFATVQQSADTAAAPARNLATRLAYIDQRLREFRHRDHNRRRSESPF